MLKFKPNEEFSFFVTHVDNEGLFLQIHGYTDKNYVIQIEENLNSINNHFDDLKPSKPQTLTANMMCCVKFQEKRYCRATICSIKNSLITVQLLDYGNVETVSIENVQIVNNIEEFKVFQMPKMLQTFILDNISPIESNWTSENLNYVKNNLIGHEVIVKYLRQLDNYHLIQIIYKRCDFAKHLVDNKIAKYISIQKISSSSNLEQSHKNMPLPVSPRLESTKRVLACHRDIEVSPPRPRIKLIPPIIAPQSNVFKSRVLEIGKVYDIYVSYVEDGPQKFSIQLAESSELLSLLMQEINRYPVEPLKEPPLPGTACLGRYIRESVLCRAVLMTVTETKCKVYYVDYGHTDVLSYSDIYQLPAEFINPLVLSIRVTLTGVKEWNITENVKKYFGFLVKIKTLKFQVCEPEGPPLIQYGILYDNDINIKDVLLNKFPDLQRTRKFQEPIKLQKTQLVRIRVAFVESCNNFFIHLIEDEMALNELKLHIARTVSSLAQLKQSELIVGTPCLALYQMDNQWYRAQILNVYKNSAKVLYIDYGNEETINLSYIKEISDELISALKCQAIKCTLNGYQGILVDSDVAAKFEQLVMDRSFYAVVEQVLSDRYIIDLKDLETKQSIIIKLKSDVQSESFYSLENQPDDQKRTDMNRKLKLKPEFNKPEREELPKRKNWKDNENEKEFDRIKAALDLGDQELKVPGKDRHFKVNQDDRFSRKEAYLCDDYDEENTFRSDKNFRINTLNAIKHAHSSIDEKEKYSRKNSSIKEQNIRSRRNPVNNTEKKNI